MKPTIFKDFLDEELKDKNFKFYYERELAKIELAKLVVKARKSEGITQQKLAKKAKTTQPVIARIESGKDSRMPSLDLIYRIAKACNSKFSITFEPIKKVGKIRTVEGFGYLTKPQTKKAHHRVQSKKRKYKIKKT